MLELMSRWRNSIGSSIVITFACRCVLMCWSIAASAVDLPDPVTPVTSTSPRGRSAISSTILGRLSSRAVFTWYGTARMAYAIVPRCWYTFTRKRPIPGTPIAKSASFASANSFTCFGVMICSASAFRSSGLSGGSSSVIRSPLTRSTGGRPTFRCTSDAFCWIIRCRTALKLNEADDDGTGMSTCAGTRGVGAAGMLVAGGKVVGLGIRVDTEEDLSVLDRMRIRDQHLAHHTRVFGLDLVHDLHRLDDAENLPFL